MDDQQTTTTPVMDPAPTAPAAPTPEPTPAPSAPTEPQPAMDQPVVPPVSDSPMPEPSAPAAPTPEPVPQAPVTEPSQEPTGGATGTL